MFVGLLAECADGAEPFEVALVERNGKKPVLLSAVIGVLSYAAMRERSRDLPRIPVAGGVNAPAKVGAVAPCRDEKVAKLSVVLSVVRCSSIRTRPPLWSRHHCTAVVMSNVFAPVVAGMARPVTTPLADWVKPVVLYVAPST